MAARTPPAAVQMVVLDQHHVEQPEPVVPAPAVDHRPLLPDAQARGGLAGVDHDSARALDRPGEAPGLCGHPGQMDEEVEHGPLGPEDAARRSLDGRQAVSIRRRRPVLHQQAGRPPGGRPPSWRLWPRQPHTTMSSRAVMTARPRRPAGTVHGEVMSPYPARSSASACRTRVRLACSFATSSFTPGSFTTLPPRARLDDQIAGDGAPVARVCAAASGRHPAREDRSADAPRGSLRGPRRSRRCARPPSAD